MADAKEAFALGQALRLVHWRDSAITMEQQADTGVVDG